MSELKEKVWQEGEAQFPNRQTPAIGRVETVKLSPYHRPLISILCDTAKTHKVSIAEERKTVTLHAQHI